MSNIRFNHAATVIAVQLDELSGILKLLYFIYSKKMRGNGLDVTPKFPTETQEASESPWQTASSCVNLEIAEEGYTVNVTCLDKDVEGRPIPFLISSCKADQGKPFDMHYKFAFVVEINSDSLPYLRKNSKAEAGDELLGPPTFIDAGELWNAMIERRGKPFHKAILFKIIERFASNEKVYARYRHLIEDRGIKQMIDKVVFIPPEEVGR